MSKRKILKDFELTEISGVDRPAQPTATMAIIKRRSDDVSALAAIEEFCKRSDENAKTFADVLMEDKVDRIMWPMTDALLRSVRSIIQDSDVEETNKKSMISDTINAFSLALSSELGVDNNPLIKIAKTILDGTITKQSKEEPNMPTKNEELQKQLDDTKKLLTTAENALTKANEFGKLNDDEKQFMADMDDDQKEAFKALSVAERKAKMDVSKSADETLIVDGATVSKSVVGDATFSVLKSQQAQLSKQQAEIKKAKDDVETATFVKRVSDEFSKLPGSPEEIAEVLKALKDAPEGVISTVEAVFKSANDVLTKTSTRQGSGFVKSNGSQTAGEQLDTLAKAHSKDNSVSYSEAYAVVIEQNTGLYEEITND